MDKNQLRNALRTRLLEIGADIRSEKSKKACQNLIETPEFQTASVVMIYLSLPHEVDTASVILHAWQRGKTVAVPKVSFQQRHMIPVILTSLETGFSTEVSGLRNPITGVPMPMEEIDIIVTPALGFDRSGNRLGRGGSYYDRFFANKDLRAIKCGMAFKEQIVDKVPTVEHDVKMDMLVTDDEVIYSSSLEGSKKYGSGSL
ncbi:MAG: 5-formyltetrahydrofolate cyclo-ligase [Planctomycetes bacterium GWF2_50_10]|nr:MAG: 5-formyltetrahydrofolate cyclo-ligase [Planctomycetes bacterium GWF2_50_10]